MLCACSESSTTANNNTVPKADAIYHNAQVYTVNDIVPWAEAVAIKRDEIVFVGSDHDALALAGEDMAIVLRQPTNEYFSTKLPHPSLD